MVAVNSHLGSLNSYCMRTASQFLVPRPKSGKAPLSCVCEELYLWKRWPLMSRVNSWYICVLNRC